MISVKRGNWLLIRAVRFGDESGSDATRRAYRFLIPVSACLFFAPAGVAQEIPGAVDLGQLSRTQTQASMMQGHAERDARRSSRGPNGTALSAKSRAYCDAFPFYRNRYGAGDPRVTRLASACRQAGYRY